MANEIPEKVWIQWYADGEVEDGFADDEAVTWCVDKINPHDVCYVTEESAVLAQAKAYRIGFAAAGEAITKELQKL